MEKKKNPVWNNLQALIIKQGTIPGDSYNCSNLLPADSFQAAVQTERALSRVIHLHFGRPWWPAYKRAGTGQDRGDRRKRFEKKTWNPQGFPNKSSAHVHKEQPTAMVRTRKNNNNNKTCGIKLVDKDIKIAVVTTLPKVKMRDGNMSM